MPQNWILVEICYKIYELWNFQECLLLVLHLLSLSCKISSPHAFNIYDMYFLKLVAIVVSFMAWVFTLCVFWSVVTKMATPVLVRCSFNKPTRVRGKKKLSKAKINWVKELGLQPKPKNKQLEKRPRATAKKHRWTYKSNSPIQQQQQQPK